MITDDDQRDAMDAWITGHAHTHGFERPLGSDREDDCPPEAWDDWIWEDDDETAQ